MIMLENVQPHGRIAGRDRAVTSNSMQLKVK